MSIVKLGSVTLDAETNAPRVQAVQNIGDDPDDNEPFGEVDIITQLGVAALPAPEDENGAAEGITIAEGGTDGSIVGSRDVRTADVVGQLSPGETALHSTGAGFDSRVLCKKKSVSIVVGDDIVVTVDGNGEKISIAGFGHIFEMSKDQGIQLVEGGGARISLQNGAVTIDGTSITLGGTASPASGVGFGVGPTSLMSTKVFVAPA